jgi:hypothetical protein
LNTNLNLSLHGSISTKVKNFIERGVENIVRYIVRCLLYKKNQNIFSFENENNEVAERGWFEEGVERLVGNGMDTLFWSDPWLGVVSLGARFPRLFNLSLHRLSTVANMRGLGWGEGGGAWLWCRPLRAWEEDLLGECRNLLANFVLQPHVTDKMAVEARSRWRLQCSGCV